MNRLIALFFCFAFAAVSNADVVKKSNSGICHDRSSTYYSRTKNFTPYDSVQDCINSGGRLPKGSKSQPDGTLHSSKVSTSSSGSIPKYKRSYFGSWADDDRDCVNTRHELLMKQSTSTIDTGSNKCTVQRGRWLDPYTGKTFYNARDVDIDHLVPLKWAWDHGAYTWTPEKRKQFANDEVNLFAVQASVNREKGALGVLDWLPPAKSFHCQYVLRFTRVVKNYGLVLSDYEQRQFKGLKEQKCGK
ncbi:HNH endonuclease family protein [Endozoicomonas sp. SCSIO W0465]|uniref:HNH endonuclease family protein n=1 Tax=Endozoicomonas sp. SCSIO W0465 TaxID=2918516 RepID=UPI0020763E79|nr:HNH endonuclease family protein [Endozoicomonas sp. SCSIO W0465]USE39512.1 HNH endonuclease family protein [Endozoicomonas sp. SCSIO W0465]